MSNYNVIKQLIGKMNTESKRIRMYNPCIVKIYKGVPVKDNNYRRLQEMDAKDLQKIIKTQSKQTNYYSQYI